MFLRIVGISLMELIPNTAFAAILISVGVKSAHPKEFIHTFPVVDFSGNDFEDLLAGIAAGIVLKIIIHVINGTSVSSFFRVPTAVSFEGDEYLVEIDKAAIFTNFLGIKRKREEIPAGFNIL